MPKMTKDKVIKCFSYKYNDFENNYENAYGVEVTKMINYENDNINKFKFKIWNGTGEIELYLFEFNEIKEMIKSENKNENKNEIRISSHNEEGKEIELYLYLFQFNEIKKIIEREIKKIYV